MCMEKDAAGFTLKAQNHGKLGLPAVAHKSRWLHFQEVTAVV